MNSRDLERMLSIFWLSLFRWRCSKCSFGWMNFREDEKKMRELFFFFFFWVFGWREERVENWRGWVFSSWIH